MEITVLCSVWFFVRVLQSSEENFEYFKKKFPTKCKFC